MRQALYALYIGSSKLLWHLITAMEVPMTQICKILSQWISERAGMETYFDGVDQPEQGPAGSAVFRLRGMKPAEPHLDDTQAGYYDERSGESLKLYHGFPHTRLRSILSSERAVRGERGRGHMCGIFAAEELETALHYAAADYLTVRREELWPVQCALQLKAFRHKKLKKMTNQYILRENWCQIEALVIKPWLRDTLPQPGDFHQQSDPFELPPNEPVPNYECFKTWDCVPKWFTEEIDRQRRDKGLVYEC